MPHIRRLDGMKVSKKYIVLQEREGRLKCIRHTVASTLVAPGTSP